MPKDNSQASLRMPISKSGTEDDCFEENPPNLIAMSVLKTLPTGSWKANPTVTESGRCKVGFVYSLTLPFIPLFALIIQNIFYIKGAITYGQIVQDDSLKFISITHIEKLVRALQRERFDVTCHLFSFTSEICGLNITDRFQITDEALENVHWPKMRVNSNDNDAVFRTKLNFQMHHNDFRLKIMSFNDPDAIIHWYTNAIVVLLNQIYFAAKESTTSMWTYLIAYATLQKSIENYGIASSYAMRTGDNIQFIRYFAMAKNYFEQTKYYVPEVMNVIEPNSIFDDALTAKMLMAQRFSKDTNNSNEIVLLFRASEDLRPVGEEIHHLIKNLMVKEIWNTTNQQHLGLAMLACALAMCPVVILILKNNLTTISIFSKSLSNRAKELEAERIKGENLIFQIIPSDVYQSILEQGDSLPERINSVTICVTDIADFDNFVRKYSAIEISNLLSNIYKTVEKLMQKFQVFKVESVNDCFVFASGVPSSVNEKLGNRHVTEIAALVFAMIKELKSKSLKDDTLENLRVRVGIHTGPIIAGVHYVANKVPRYRVYGETVQMAYRLNSIGLAHQIHVSNETKNLLDDVGGGNFCMKKRGTIEVKTGIAIETYWLIPPGEDFT